jgi:hypothetical protein
VPDIYRLCGIVRIGKISPKYCQGSSGLILPGRKRQFEMTLGNCHGQYILGMEISRHPIYRACHFVHIVFSILPFVSFCAIQNQDFLSSLQLLCVPLDAGLILSMSRRGAIESHQLSMGFGRSNYEFASYLRLLLTDCHVLIMPHVRSSKVPFV